MKLERHDTAREVALRAADLVQELLAAKPEAVLLLPAGATPIPLYDELLARARRGALDLSRAHLFQLDEIVGVARDDERSFHHFLERHLVGPLGLGARVRRLDGCADDPGHEIARHARDLAALGGADLVLLGLGRNGHVAFNEPGTESGQAARVVELSPTTRAGLEATFGTRIPQQGMTLGLAEIRGGRELVLLVTGASKAEVLAAVLEEGPTLERPASLLGDHPRLSVLADRAATERLDRAR